MRVYLEKLYKVILCSRCVCTVIFSYYVTYVYNLEYE